MGPTALFDTIHSPIVLFQLTLSLSTVFLAIIFQFQ